VPDCFTVAVRTLSNGCGPLTLPFNVLHTLKPPSFIIIAKHCIPKPALCFCFLFSSRNRPWLARRRLSHTLRIPPPPTPSLYPPILELHPILLGLYCSHSLPLASFPFYFSTPSGCHFCHLARLIYCGLPGPPVSPHHQRGGKASALHLHSWMSLSVD
jgi:hypothetical protein